MRLFFLLVSLVWIAPAYAQQDSLRKAVPPNSLREADVLLSKRVWRVIDLREKQNHIAIWPKNPVNKILYDAVLDGRLRPYKNDSLKRWLNVEEFIRIGNDTQFAKVATNPDDADDYVIDTVVSSMIPEQRIPQLLLMEEWYFDRKLSTMIPRIIAIAPLYRIRFAGTDVGLEPLCWLRYYDRFNKETDCRDVLVNQNMFNKENSYSTFTYDDWFEQRRFNSFIIKESNPYDISIMDDPEVRKSGLEALIRAQKLKLQQFKRDTDLYEE